MALVSTSIPNLLNGVSQQPAPLRQATQGETQTNALSSVIDGLIKRPPTEHIKELISSSVSNAAIHIIDKGGSVLDIIVIVPNGTLTVYRSDGTELTLTYSGGASSSYFACTNPAKELKFLTVNDYTLILNTTKSISTSLDTHNEIVSTTKYNDFSKLPDGVDGDNATTNTIYEVIDAGSSSNGFYVKAISTSTYEESLLSGERYRIDPATMPVKMVDLGTTYTISQIDWAERTVGDITSVPFPSFVGSKISNLFFYKNRLGFLSRDNVIFSAAGDYFRFFPKTVRTILDDSPIDVSTLHTKESQLKQAVAFNDSLTIFSEHTQFTIENTGALTPKTISIIPSTEFENDAEVMPVGSGNYLYFTSKKGEYSSLREYYIEADTVMSDALDITAHVPKYVPKNITKLATSSNEDILVCLSSEDKGKLYVYKWFTDGRQKLQSSWSTWELPTGANVLDMAIVESELYLVVSYVNQNTAADGVCIEKIDLQYINDTGLDYCIRADRKTSVSGTYNSVTDETTWELPYTPDSTSTLYIIRNGDWLEANSLGFYQGTNITVASLSGNQVKASGQHNLYPCTIGVSYPMTYGFSPQYIREKDGSQSIQSGRLQMRTMRVSFENTGFFKVEVTPVHRSTYTYEYTGVTLNQAGSTIGTVILNDGTFRFPLQSKNDQLKVEIKSDSFLPCAFQSAEWEGFYNIRSKRL